MTRIDSCSGNGVRSAGEVRQRTEAVDPNDRRYLVIFSGTPDVPGAVVQVQIE